MFSSSFKQHLTDLSPLQHFARSKSFYQPEECKFACDEVSYLGYIIGPADLKTDPAKVSAVLVSHPPRIKTPYVPSSVSPRVWMLSRLIIPQSLRFWSVLLRSTKTWSFTLRSYKMNQSAYLWMLLSDKWNVYATTIRLFEFNAFIKTEEICSLYMMLPWIWLQWD